jgi:hypothetical protein
MLSINLVVDDVLRKLRRNSVVQVYGAVCCLMCLLEVDLVDCNSHCRVSWWIFESRNPRMELRVFGRLCPTHATPYRDRCNVYGGSNEKQGVSLKNVPLSTLQPQSTTLKFPRIYSPKKCSPLYEILDKVCIALSKQHNAWYRQGVNTLVRRRRKAAKMDGEFVEIMI